MVVPAQEGFHRESKSVYPSQMYNLKAASFL